MPDDIRTTIGDLPRATHGHPRTRELTAAQIETLLASDDLEDATRRNLEGRLETLRHQAQRRDELNASTAKDIVDSIPRHR